MYPRCIALPSIFPTMDQAHIMWLVFAIDGPQIRSTLLLWRASMMSDHGRTILCALRSQPSCPQWSFFSMKGCACVHVNGMPHLYRRLSLRCYYCDDSISRPTLTLDYALSFRCLDRVVPRYLTAHLNQSCSRRFSSATVRGDHCPGQ